MAVPISKTARGDLIDGITVGHHDGMEATAEIFTKTVRLEAMQREGVDIWLDRADVERLGEEMGSFKRGSRVTIVRDGVNEDVAVVINGRKVADCKNYETDHWVSAIVEALGGTYEEVVDVERLEGLLGVGNG